MTKKSKEITFHHFDDEPFRILSIPGTLLNLIAMRWPNRIFSYELVNGRTLGCDCVSFQIVHSDQWICEVKYIFYTSKMVFANNKSFRKQDVVLLDLMKPGTNGGALERQGIDCFVHAKEFVGSDRIFVVSAYSHEFTSEKLGVNPLPDQCYSKPIDVRTICDKLIEKIDAYVSQY